MKNTRRVVIEGRKYDIPDIWIAGFCQNGKTPPQAVEYWHKQELLAEQWEREKGGGADVVPVLADTPVPARTRNMGSRDRRGNNRMGVS